MTQQEIKENMTQGTWNFTPKYDITINDINQGCDCGHTSILVSKENTLAITHAINNTYGKGINPESVPDMYNALQSIHQHFSGTNSNDMADTIQDILNKAAL